MCHVQSIKQQWHTDSILMVAVPVGTPPVLIPPEIPLVAAEPAANDNCSYLFRGATRYPAAGRIFELLVQTTVAAVAAWHCVVIDVSPRFSIASWIATTFRRTLHPCVDVATAFGGRVATKLTHGWRHTQSVRKGCQWLRWCCEHVPAAFGTNLHVAAVQPRLYNC